jgi:endonuclease/exonuclease/phosphatase family metal-dependent hydrolase
MALVLATFNVLDLFDATDPARIDRIASLLRAHSADVVALQEVGGEAATNAIAVALGGGFTQVLGDTDERGIRNALLSRLPIVSSNVLRAAHLSFPRFRREDPEPFGARIPLRRAIPEVVVDAGDVGHVRFMVVHFKSRRGTPMRDEASAIIEPQSTVELAAAEARAVAWRCAEALFVRGVIDERLAKNPDDRLVVCGDFNDVSGSLPLRIVMGTAGTDAPRADALVSVAELIPIAERISVLHGGEPTAIDHALVSPALATHLDHCAYDRTGLIDLAASATTAYASDHAPLVVRFA